MAATTDGESNTTADVYVQRVSQLDAGDLDEELHSLLKEQMSKAVKYLKPRYWSAVEPELDAILRLILIVARIAFGWSENALQATTLINSLWFLVEGKYSRLLERVLKLKPVHASPQSIRQVSYEYLNRELLWHGFAEFLAFVFPLLNVRRFVNFVCRRLPVFSSAEPTGPSQRTRADYMECAICEQWPTLPHEIGCSHVFCYYCIASNIDTDPNFRCPKCSLQVKLNDPIKCVIVE